MKMWHMGICVGLMALAVILVAVGGGAFAFIAPLGCLAMMVMMVWMMAPRGLKEKARGFAAGVGKHEATGR
jgi:hypothetical protein